MSRAVHMNASWSRVKHTYKCVMAQTRSELERVLYTENSSNISKLYCRTSHMWVWHVTLTCWHVTYASVAWQTYEWVMNAFTYVISGYRGKECVASHIWISNVTRVNQSWHTSECAVFHMWMSCVTCWRCTIYVVHMRISHVKHQWVMSHMWIWLMLLLLLRKK